MRLFWIIFALVMVAAGLPALLIAGTAWRTQGSLMPIAIAAVVGLVAATVLAWSVASRISRPLKEFGELAVSIARGKFGVQVQHSSGDELGELAKTLNYMSASIEAFDAETQRLADHIEAGYLETIVALANSIDSKDPYTRGHGQRVAELAAEIGKELQVSEEELKHLKYGAILHDIGKIGIMEAILFKPARLDDREMVAMREHPVIGDNIIRPVRLLSKIRAAVRNHHEWYDGTGYPDGLKGDAIPLIARIVACADTWDACTSTRPYQVALNPHDALAVIDRLTGTQIDPKVAAALRRIIERKKVVTGPVKVAV
ncbi:MAG: HD domain-containing protein [Myxococcaceae bacterium]